MPYSFQPRTNPFTKDIPVVKYSPYSNILIISFVKELAALDKLSCSTPLKHISVFHYIKSKKIYLNVKFNTSKSIVTKTKINKYLYIPSISGNIIPKKIPNKRADNIIIFV